MIFYYKLKIFIQSKINLLNRILLSYGDYNMRKFLFTDILKLILMALIGGAVFFSIVHFFVRPVYSANTILRVTTTAEAEGFTRDKGKINTYNEVLQSNKIRDQILGNLEIDFKPEEFKKKVKADALGESHLFEIKVNDTIAERSMDLANESAEIFQKDISAFLQGEEVEIIDEAKLPTKADLKYKAAAVVLGAAIGILIGVIKKLKKKRDDDSFMSVEALKERYEILVLGEIPQINKESKTSREISNLFKEEENAEED